MHRAADDHPMLQLVLVERLDGNAPALRERLMQPVCIVQHLQQIERLMRQIEPFRFDLRHVQNVADHREQLVGRPVDLLQAHAHARRIVHVLPRDAEHADDAVDGRAHVMRHAREELRLGRVGRLGIK